MSWGLKFRIVLLIVATLLAILAIIRTGWLSAVAMALVMTSLLIQIYHEGKTEKDSKD
jgi:disulfide bond formation protein DsbB